MLNLLKVEFKTLFKLKPTKLSIVGSLVLAALMSLISVLNEEPAMTSLFNGIFIVNLISVAIGGLFVNNDFSQNTIRNKMVVGHSRWSVYCSKFSTVLTFYIMISIAYMLPSFLINYFCLETEGIVWEAMWKNFALVGMSIIINAIITVFLAMEMRNAAGVVLPIAVAEGLPVAGTLLLEVLSVSDIPKLFKFVKSIPNIQTMMLYPQIIPENVWLSFTITCGTVVVLFAIGYLSFRKADLN